MIVSQKVRLKPTEEQTKMLYKSSGVARFIYNWTLGVQQENHENGGKLIQDGELRKRITKMKQTPEFEWLKEVSNNIPKQAVKDACKVYISFFKGKSKFPKFKSKRKAKPSFYNDNFALEVKDKMVLIEKVGWIKTSEQIPKDCKYTNPRITFDGKYWYLSVGIEQEVQKYDLTDESLGIDLGIKELATCSNGMVFENINKSKTMKKEQKKLKRLQRKCSKKYQKNLKERNVKTQNIIKLEEQIRHTHRRISNLRNNHLHQTTSTLVKTKPCRIVIEDLNVKGMMKNIHLSKSIQGQCFYEFRRQLEYKCQLYGIELVVADRFYPSSKTCSCCGFVKSQLKLSERTYNCENCGSKIDRDLNAAINLSYYK